MNSLPYNHVTDLLVDFNVDSSFCDVPDTIGATMVELLGHTLVNGSIYLNVNIVTDLVGLEVSQQRNVTFIFEGSNE